MRTDLSCRQLTDVVVIIPAFNEAESLPLVLKDLPPVGRVVVVDNASTDDTAQIGRKMGAHVVHESRRGYGAACLAGIQDIRKAVLDRSFPQPVVVAFLDADYSDRPELLYTLVEPILTGQEDLVLGSRIRGERELGAMPLQSIWGNWLACFLMRWLWKANFTDLGPFRAIRYESLQLLNMQDQSFGWTIEMQIKAMRAGLRIREIPIPYRRRIGTSKISGTISGSLKAGYRILLTILKYRCHEHQGASSTISQV